MRRLIAVLLLTLALAGTAVSTVAQDATPATDSLLSSLGYPVIDVTSDGKTISGPAELAAGRYLLHAESTSDANDWSVVFLRPAEGQTIEELSSLLSNVDPATEEAPDWYYNVVRAGGTSSPSTEAIVDLQPGEWLLTGNFFAGEGVTFPNQIVTVTGEATELGPIPDAVQVGLIDMSIEMPESIPAGPHVWQVTNSGALTHFVWVMQAPGPITNADAINGIKLFYGMADATPVAEGSAGDPNGWADIAGSPDLSSGQSMAFELSLEPGTYVVACYIEGPGDLGSHALHGMIRVLTVK